MLSPRLVQDSSLIITGSADKNIKIWGLDYGDCHKSIFGHDDRLVKHHIAVDKLGVTDKL